MLVFLPWPVLGVISSILVFVNTILCISILFPVSLLKFLIPINKWRRLLGRILVKITGSWISVNKCFMLITTGTKWEIEGLEDLNLNKWYIVISNHQTNLDILVLQKIFHNQIPFLKFFIKNELKWVPMMGLAWWALDFPFMKRYSRDFIKKNPHLKGKDFEATKKACEKFRYVPTAIVNYIEGTRFKSHLHTSQASEYDNLLKPRAGGVGYVLSIMGDMIDSIIDVTIVYHSERKGLWDFMCGRVDKIVVRINQIPITKELTGDYVNDEDFRINFQDWLNRLWESKDREITRLKSSK